MFYAPLFCAEPVYSIKTYSFIYIDNIYNVYIFIPRSTYLHLQNSKFLFESRIKNNRLLLLKVFMCTKTRTIYITAVIMQYITHTTQSIVYACGLLPIAYTISVCVCVRERDCMPVFTTGCRIPCLKQVCVQLQYTFFSPKYQFWYAVPSFWGSN